VTNKGLDTSQSEGSLLEASYFGLCAATEDKKEGTTPSSKSARLSSTGGEEIQPHTTIQKG